MRPIAEIEREPNAERKRPSTVTIRKTTALLLLVLVATYTNLPITIGGARFAGGVAFLAGGLLAMMLMFDRTVPRFRSGIRPIIGIVLAWSASIPFSPVGLGFLVENVKSLILLGGSLASGWAVYCLMSTMNRDTIRKSFRAVALVVLVLAALEPYTPLKSVSDAVREILYSDSFLYSSELRDMQIAGIVRPMLFTQEPSHLAKFIAVCLCTWRILETGPSALPITTLLFAFAIVVTGSPTIVLGFGIYVIFLLFRAMDASLGGSGSPASLIAKLSVLAVVVVAYTNLPVIASFLPGSRAEAIAAGTDVSSLIRTTGSFETAWETIKTYPISGAGIGGRELVQDILISVYAKYPAVFMQRFDEGVGYIGWGNAFAEMIVYGGIFVGAFIYYVQFKNLRIFIRDVALLLAVFFLLTNSDAGYVTPRPWIYFGLLSMAIGHAARTSAVAARSAPARTPVRRGVRPQRGSMPPRPVRTPIFSPTDFDVDWRSDPGKTPADRVR